MQQLQEKLKNVPRNASQVPCSTNPGLNKEETLSDQGIVLSCNNSEVNLRQRKDGSDLRVLNIVYVLNQRGKPLMPTTQAKARKLIRGEKAKVVKRLPFTIQLITATGETKQEITLGIDTGFGNIGFSAIAEKSELISGTLVLDGKTKERLEERKMYRRGRRNKLWYRKPRFDNRISEKKEGWLPPSVLRRYNTHLTLIKRLKKLLPISEIILEIAKFDIQKIENPKIEGKEYQQGNLYDYQNMRSYLMTKQKGKCLFCKKDFKGQSSHIHHIKPKSKGGNDRSENLALLHKSCHTELHEKHLENYLKSSSTNYNQSTFMNIINKRFYKDIPDVKVTFGNITFVNRNKLNLEKTHYNDAFVIANGTLQNRCAKMIIKQKHINNRAIQMNRKGFAPAVRKQRYSIQPGDLVKINNSVFQTNGVHCKGARIMIEGKSLAVKKLDKWVYHFGSLITGAAIPPTPKVVGFLAGLS